MHFVRINNHRTKIQLVPQHGQEIQLMLWKTMYPNLGQPQRLYVIKVRAFPSLGKDAVCYKSKLKKESQELNQLLDKSVQELNFWK